MASLVRITRRNHYKMHDSNSIAMGARWYLAAMMDLKAVITFHPNLFFGFGSCGSVHSPCPFSFEFWLFQNCKVKLISAHSSSLSAPWILCWNYAKMCIFVIFISTAKIVWLNCAENWVMACSKYLQPFQGTLVVLRACKELWIQ